MSVIWRSLDASKFVVRWLVRLVFAAGFGALITAEWKSWPNGSPLLGPFGIVWYNGIGIESAAICAISLALLFAFPVKPGVITALVSFVGAVNWFFWGLVALGIGC